MSFSLLEYAIMATSFISDIEVHETVPLVPLPFSFCEESALPCSVAFKHSVYFLKLQRRVMNPHVVW